MTPITGDEFATLDGLDDWRYVLRTLQAEFGFGSFSAAAGFVASVASAADAAVHHPDLALRYPGRVRVTLKTHAEGEVTDLDVSLARTISSLAAQLGATSVPASGQSLEVAIDTMDADRIRPFWAAVLGYLVTSGGDLEDPRRVGPRFWFQDMEEPRTERQRFHIDVNVPHDEAEARIAAALAAGGRMVTDEFARAWWVLADADGNEACISTWQDRD